MRAQEGDLLPIREILLRTQISPDGSILNALENGGRGLQGIRGETRRPAKREPFTNARLPRRWGIVLAGGDGLRLRRLTRLIYDDDRPKQFCSLLGNNTLLQQTRWRAERSIRADQILYSVTKSHQDYYLRDLADRPLQRIVQPCNRGTAPAILNALLHIAVLDPDAVVAIFPCDHYYSPERAFTDTLESAFTIAGAWPESVVVLGAQPNAPEVEYGWIELGNPVAGSRSDLFRVKRFQEKPPFQVAAELYRAGSLWNTFVMVGHVRAFLAMAHESVPGLMEVIRSAQLRATVDGDLQIPTSLYARISSMDFSRQVLSPGVGRLVSKRLGDMEWNDLGDPDRVISLVLRNKLELPAWAVRWQAENALKRSATQFSVSVAIA